MTIISILNHNVGLISMTNEDGLQWLANIEGITCWSHDKCDASHFTFQHFTEMSDNVEMSRVRDCPDNGFLGIYRLTFHEGAIIPIKSEEQKRREQEEEEEFEAHMRRMYGPDYDTVSEQIEPLTDAEFHQFAQAMAAEDASGANVLGNMMRDFKRLI